MRIRLKQTALMALFVLISLAMLFPFIITVLTSLKTMAEIQSPVFRLFPANWEFANYAEAMRRGNWGRYFLNSLTVTSVTVLLTILFATMAGYGFARLRFPGRNLLFYAVLVGVLVPPQVTMIPAFILLKSMPLAGGNDVLGQGGTGFINTYPGLIIPGVAAPIAIFLCRQFYMNFPRALDQAAEIDGATKIRTFWQIYLPLSAPIIATLAILKSTSEWNDFMWPLIMVNNEAMMTVQLALTVFRSENTVEWSLLMAATVLVILPLVALFLLFQRFFVQGIVTSGIKG